MRTKHNIYVDFIELTGHNGPFTKLQWLLGWKNQSAIDRETDSPRDEDEDCLSEQTVVIRDFEETNSENKERHRNDDILHKELDQILYFGIHGFHNDDRIKIAKTAIKKSKK